MSAVDVRNPARGKPMTVAIGDRLPKATFLERGPEGVRAVESGTLLDGRNIALFGLPGAFTGTCSSKHVPSFIRAADSLRARGIDEIVCVSVNDPFVMGAWSDATGAGAAGIRMLADPSGAFVQALGLAFDRPESGLFGRSKRFSLQAVDGEVRQLNLEPNTGQCQLTAGETLLEQV
jgi:glutaredoxin/glutathione-dependent peroxiredoxin